MMGGGRGGGFFTETHGWRASEAFAKGTLLAAAAQNTATDAGSTSGGMLDFLRPWWSYPYGHPEKTKNIKLLQGLVKSGAEKMGRGFASHPDLQEFLIRMGVIFIKKQKILKTNIILTKQDKTTLSKVDNSLRKAIVDFL